MARLAAFEGAAGGAPDAEALRRAHTRYVRDFMEIGDGVPHTFMAALEPPLLSAVGLDPHQRIVRLESLERVFSNWALPSDADPLETLRKAVAAKDIPILDGFLDTWNDATTRDHRPAFAAWKDELEAELTARDWADRLRDRLGLEHYDCVNGPIPVALMEYQVKDVVSVAQSLGLTNGITAPTVLDTRLGPYFFPSPSQLPYGRVMSLAPIVDDNDLLAEMLHVRLTYRPEHLARVGTISRPPVPHELRGLRNQHLFALQIAANRDDFGEEMP